MTWNYSVEMPAMKLARWNKLVAACLLAGLCLALAACGRAGELVDEGPNSKLSNEELLAEAIDNMKQVESYQVVFRGGMPGDYIKMSQSMVITAEIQPTPRGTRFWIRDEAGQAPNAGPNPDSLDLTGGAGVDVLLTEKETYHSYDGGKTWTTWGVDTPEGYLFVMFVPVWTVQEGPNGPGTMGEELVRGLTFKDGTPRLEVVDGVITRHMVAERQPSGSQDDEGSYMGLTPLPTGTIHLWASTDVTPTIRQMRVEGSTVLRKNRVYSVRDVAISPDGKTLAAAHDDGRVQLWDIQGGGAPRKLKGKPLSLTSLAFSPDGKTLAVGTHTGGGPAEVRLYDMSKPDADPVSIFVPGSVSSVAFRLDGRMLGAGASDGIYLWDLPYERGESAFLQHPVNDVVNAIAFSPDGNRVASGNLSAGVRVYDLRDLEAEPLVLEHEHVDDVAFSADGYLLASIGIAAGAKGSPVKIWDLRQAPPTAVMLPRDQAQGRCIAFSPDNRWLATADQNGGVNLWEVSQITSPDARPLELGGEVWGDPLAFSPDSARLASGNTEGEVRLWDLRELPRSASTVLKEDEQPTDTPFTLLWKWSRFNEDFGKVEPPPPDTVKKPY
jgi:WD40 repeat protein